MHERRNLLLPGDYSVIPVPGFTPRVLLAAVFRQGRLILLTFAIVFVPILLLVLLRPSEYAAETKILVQRQRFDPVITSGANDEPADAGMRPLEEQDVDAEIDLLQSQDLLRRVVVKEGLAREESGWRRFVPAFSRTSEERVERAARMLRNDLLVEPPNRSNLVTVRYRSSDPQQAASVLKALTELYLEKHLQVHRPAGSSQFFEQEVERNRQVLHEAETRLVEFGKAEGVVSPEAEDASLIQQMATMDVALQNTNAQIAATRQRIKNLESQLSKVSPRVTTMVRTSPVLLEKLRGTLHELELKRTELLTKYKPEYRLVQDIESQIAQTQTAIAHVEQSPTAERTTDQDPVYAWLQGELAKARAELSSLTASARRSGKTLQEYRDRGARLSELGQKQQDLARAVKVSEEAYMASLRKQSEARLSEALDRSRIMNVAVAEPPVVPALPVRSPLRDLALGFGLAVACALGMAIVADRWDPSFRSPQEVEAVLEMPVLAAIPDPRAILIERSQASRRLAS